MLAHGLEESRFRRICEWDGSLGRWRVPARGICPDVACATWLSAAASAAACEGESDADGDATLAVHFAKGRDRDGGLQRRGNAARQRPRLGNDGGEHPLTTSPACSISFMHGRGCGKTNEISGRVPYYFRIRIVEWLLGCRCSVV